MSTGVIVLGVMVLGAMDAEVAGLSSAGLDSKGEDASSLVVGGDIMAGVGLAEMLRVWTGRERGGGFLGMAVAYLCPVGL